MKSIDVLNWGEQVATFLKENWIEEAPEELAPFVQMFLLEEYTMGWRKSETGHAYRNYYELVRRHGALRQQALIVPDHPVFELMELGECYYNAYVAASELGYQYVEGYAQTDLTIVPHAWIEDEDGTIIDPTWANLGLASDFQIAYFGVKFDTAFVVDRANATAHCAVLGSDWMVRAPILRHGLTFEGDIAVALNDGGPDA